MTMENRFGFRPGIDTGEALYSLTSLMYDALDKRMSALAIFLDITKTVDNVNHT